MANFTPMFSDDLADVICDAVEEELEATSVTVERESRMGSYYGRRDPEAVGPDGSMYGSIWTVEFKDCDGDELSGVIMAVESRHAIEATLYLPAQVTQLTCYDPRD